MWQVPALAATVSGGIVALTAGQLSDQRLVSGLVLIGVSFFLFGMIVQAIKHNFYFGPVWSLWRKLKARGSLMGKYGALSSGLLMGKYGAR